MKSIEISTSQNVTVQYTLASIFDRIVAQVFDLFVMGLGFLLCLSVLGSLAPALTETAIYCILAPLIIFYSLFFEQVTGGQSPGKMLMRLRVIRLDGENAGFLDYLMRWMFRGLDVYFSLGGVGMLSIASTQQNQRVGDILANTCVVKVGKKEHSSLEDLMKLHQTGSYKVTYPQVVKMREEQMLLVKETLDRSLRLENQAHTRALELLADKMRRQLDIKAPGEHRKLLRTLLQDYVVLTR